MDIKGVMIIGTGMITSTGDGITGIGIGAMAAGDIVVGNIFVTDYALKLHYNLVAIYF
jgi:hypothetical protein